MSITHRQFNWSGVGFGPSMSPVMATGVTNVSIATNGSVQKFSGDNNHGPTTIVNDFTDPEVTVTTADEIWLSVLTPGQRGVLVGVHKDAKGVTLGGIAITLANAIVVDTPFGGAHRQYGSGTVRFNAEWSDDVTDPLSYALV